MANLRDAVQWLGYTYLHVRMRKNPFFYGNCTPLRRSQFPQRPSTGIPRDTLLEDPQLGGKRHELIKYATNRLADVKMIVVDPRTESYIVTELGRIAAKYYLRSTSMEIFNKEFRPRMSEADVLAMLSMSTEVRRGFLCSQFLIPS